VSNFCLLSLGAIVLNKYSIEFSFIKKSKAFLLKSILILFCTTIFTNVHFQEDIVDKAIL